MFVCVWKREEVFIIIMYYLLGHIETRSKAPLYSIIIIISEGKYFEQCENVCAVAATKVDPIKNLYYIEPISRHMCCVNAAIQ